MFKDYVKILIAFIIVDVILTVLAPIVTGFSFVAMNSLSVKVVTAAVSVLFTATTFTIFHKIKEKKNA